MFKFQNLDAKTREYMLDEIQADIKNNKLYFGKRLSKTGRIIYPSILLEAAKMEM